MTKNNRGKEQQTVLRRGPDGWAAMAEAGPGYQVARLRARRGLSQAELAGLVGTKQPSIARLESGQREPSLSFLRRVVEALGGKLSVQITGDEEAVQ